MSSGMRLILREIGLWLVVFTAALAAFLYLDGRIETFLAERDATTADAGLPAAETAEPALRTVHAEPEPPSDPDDESSPGRVVLRAGESGHFEVKAYINNRRIDLLADTGATYVVLSYDDADNLGLTGDLDYSGTARTANGVSRVAPVLLSSVEVGDIKMRDVKAIVAEKGALHTSLLGMSFIGRLQSFEMSGRKLVLVN